MRRRTTRSHVEEMLRFDRGANSRTGAAANAAQQGRDKQRITRTTSPCRVRAILTDGVRHDDKYARARSEDESDQSTLERVATGLRDPRHIRGGPLTRAVVHEQLDRRR